MGVLHADTQSQYKAGLRNVSRQSTSSLKDKFYKNLLTIFLRQNTEYLKFNVYVVKWHNLNYCVCVKHTMHIENVEVFSF